jgi:tripartite ATP-independent transporter DctM subunit
MITALIFAALLALLAAGMPIGFAMGVAGVLGLYVQGGMDTVNGVLSTAPFSTVSTYELLSIPMFILMAEFVIVSRIADELYDSLVIWVGRTRGGLAIATAFAGAGFGAICGSSTAGAATLASISLPAMLRHGYEPKLANGVVAISGTLAMLIPPALALVLYGLLTELSVAKLLMAGLVPGLLVTLVIAATVLLLVWQDPSRAPMGERYTMWEKLASLRVTGAMLVLITLVTGVIYLGLATPTEASSLGALGACGIALFRRRLTFKLFTAAIANAARTSAMISMIIVGAHVFGYALTLTQATQSFVAAIAGLHVSRYVVISLILLLKLALGCFLDQVAILLLTVPIMVPVIKELGFDPIWFGVVLVLTAEVGMITPPVGMNCFVVARYTGRPVEEIFAGVWPHFVAHILAIIFFTAFPQVVLWLPTTMSH